MDTLSQIALIYEDQLSDRREKYLVSQYTRQVEETIPAPEWWVSSHEDRSLTQEIAWFVVTKVDPTHGKYSDWVMRNVIDLVRHKQGKSEKQPFRLYSEWEADDAYKIKNALELFDRSKQRLSVDRRDINKYTFQGLLILANEISHVEQTQSAKQLAAKVKSTETVRLISNLHGWTVVIPLTRDSARLYGAHTQWCTAARSDDDNRFDDYDASGCLIIIINGDKKYQWWGNVDHPSDGPEFNNARDEYASVTDVPGFVWDRLTRLRFKTTGRIRRSLMRLNTWLDELGYRGDDDEDPMLDS